MPRRRTVLPAVLLFALNARAVFINVAANDIQIQDNGSWTASTFSASGTVNGTDSSICSPGEATFRSSTSGNSLGFSFIGVAIEIITVSSSTSKPFQVTLDGIAGTVGAYSQQDACGISFQQSSLTSGTHTVNVQLLSNGPLDIIGFRYDDGTVASSTSTTSSSGSSPTSTSSSGGKGSGTSSGGGSNTGAIIGGIVGGIVAGLALAALATWCFLRNRRRDREMDASRDQQELLATPWGHNSHSATHLTGPQTQVAPSYYNNATSYYPSDAGSAYRGAGPPGGYAVSSGTTGSAPSMHRSGGGTLHDDDVERIAARMAAMVGSPIQNVAGASGQGFGGGYSVSSSGSASGYNAPDPTPTSAGSQPQRGAKAEYIARQQRPGAPGVNRAPDADSKRPPAPAPTVTPDEPPPAY